MSYQERRYMIRYHIIYSTIRTRTPFVRLLCRGKEANKEGKDGRTEGRKQERKECQQIRKSHRLHGRPQLGLGVEDLERLEVFPEVADFQALRAGEQPGVALRLLRRKPLARVHDQELADEILEYVRKKSGKRSLMGARLACQVILFSWSSIRRPLYMPKPASKNRTSAIIAKNCCFPYLTLS